MLPGYPFFPPEAAGGQHYSPAPCVVKVQQVLDQTSATQIAVERKNENQSSITQTYRGMTVKMKMNVKGNMYSNVFRFRLRAASLSNMCWRARFPPTMMSFDAVIMPTFGQENPFPLAMNSDLW